MKNILYLNVRIAINTSYHIERMMPFIVIELVLKKIIRLVKNMLVKDPKVFLNYIEKSI